MYITATAKNGYENTGSYWHNARKNQRVYIIQVLIIENFCINILLL